MITKTPLADKWIRRFIGGDELINNVERYCLWLKSIPPGSLKEMPEVLNRIKKVQNARLESNKKRTREWAEYPSLFTEDRQPSSDYLGIPKVSSERRKYLPICFVSKEWIASGSLLVLPDANQYHFGVLCSNIHNSWMRTVCGRMKSDYQYSAGIVYNNYPWPSPNESQVTAIEKTAQAVIDIRKIYVGATLADLYDPLTMPMDLAKAHQALDKAVDAAYGYKGGKDDAARVAFLFGLYQQLVDAQKPTLADESTPPAPSSTAPPPKRIRKPKT